MNRAGYTICWAVAALVAFAPLPFGSVYPLSSAALEVCILALGLFWVSARVRAGLTPLPWRDPLLLGGAALLAYGLLQIVPMPPGLLGALSPSAGALRAGYAPSPDAWSSLSIYPYATWRSCLRISCWTLAALMARHNAVDLKGRLVVAGGFVAGGLFQAGYGLFEFISGRQHIFGYTKKYFTDVATGTFISRNNYAGYLEMAIPMALALAMLALASSERRRGGDGSAALGREALKRRLAAMTGRGGFRALLLLMGAFLMATALLMSRSRMGILAMGAGLVAGGVVLGLTGRTRRFAAASLGVAAVVVVFASQIDILPVLDRFWALRHEFGEGYGRLRVWTQALPLLAAYPVFGSGLGTWEMAFSPFREDRAQVRVDFAHNDYLEFVAEAGLAGVAIVAAVLVLALWRRAPGSGEAQDEVALGACVGLVAIALHSMTDFHLSIPADALAASVMLGLFLRPRGPVTGVSVSAVPARAVVAAGQNGRAQAPRGRPASLRVRGGAAACLALLATLAIFAASPAAAEMNLSPQEARLRDDPRDVDAGVVAASTAAPGEDLCAACRLEPFNAARYIEAASRARRRLLKDVEALLASETQGAVAEPATRRYLAGRIDAALGLARRGLELAPADGRGHLESGLLHFGRFALIGLPPQASDDFELAREAFERALRLQPWRASSHRKIARLMVPLWALCDEVQQAFITRTVRAAVRLDPSAADLAEAAGRMGA